jgi:GT2 family glycosyltransferase
MEDRVAVSVVVPTIGRHRLLRVCLQSIAACDALPDEVLVIDQSGDAETEHVVQEFRSLGVTQLQCRPAGIARAMNVALATARHKWLLVTHDDCTVDRTWIRTGAGLAAAAGPGTIITGRVLPAGDSSAVPSTKTDVEAHDYTGDRRWDVLYPSNMILPVPAVTAIGGFDELFEAAAEDNDLCYRWLKSGHRLEYRPELVVLHHDWRTRAQLDALYTRYWYGTGQFYAKHLYLGDLRVLRYLGRDLIGFGRARTSIWIRRKRDETPYARPMLDGLPSGMLDGWRAVRRIRRT